MFTWVEIRSQRRLISLCNYISGLYIHWLCKPGSSFVFIPELIDLHTDSQRTQRLHSHMTFSCRNSLTSCRQPVWAHALSPIYDCWENPGLKEVAVAVDRPDEGKHRWQCMCVFLCVGEQFFCSHICSSLFLKQQHMQTSIWPNVADLFHLMFYLIYLFIYLHGIIPLLSLYNNAVLLHIDIIVPLYYYILYHTIRFDFYYIYFIVWYYYCTVCVHYTYCTYIHYIY